MLVTEIRALRRSFSLSLQKQAMLVRQLEDELRHQKARGLSVEVQSQLENLSTENDHLTREVAILRETIKVSTCNSCSCCRKVANDPSVTPSPHLLPSYVLLYVVVSSDLIWFTHSVSAHKNVPQYMLVAAHTTCSTLVIVGMKA